MERPDESLPPAEIQISLIKLRLSRLCTGSAIMSCCVGFHDNVLDDAEISS